MKKYLPAVFLSIAFVLLLFFLNNRNSLNFVENNPPIEITPTAIPTETKWQTYRNEKYGFEFQYPNRFMSEKVAPYYTQDNFYKTIAQYGNGQTRDYEQFVVHIIKDVDVYQNAKAEDVAKREIIDSGQEYTITPTNIDDYSAAITSFVNFNNASVLITIKHPTKNLFVILQLQRDMSKVEFEEILSTFKFLDKTPNTNSVNTFSDPGLGIKFNYSSIFLLDPTKVPILYNESPNNRWVITLNTADGDLLNIQPGTPSDWPDCTDRLESKKIDSTLDISYFKETNSKANYCSGGQDYVGWYATIIKDDKNSWFVSLSSKDISKDNQLKLETPFLELIKSFEVLNQ